jgi:hypothetical protein
MLLHRFLDLIFEHFRKLLHPLAGAQAQRLQGHHVVLVHWSVARRRWMRARIDDFENGEPLRAVLGEQRVQLLVREQERVRARGVRVEVDDMGAREVAREEDVDGVCRDFVVSGSN